MPILPPSTASLVAEKFTCPAYTALIGEIGGKYVRKGGEIELQVAKQAPLMVKQQHSLFFQSP